MFLVISRGTSIKNITLFLLQHNEQPENYCSMSCFKSDPRRAEYRMFSQV